TRIACFVDSISAIRRILDPTLHSAQPHSLRAIRAIRPWLDYDPAHHVSFYWTPSHVGIAGNEEADRLA
ncbi:hypothetical protein BDN72DRAFT_735341, partial [Pluteus cervinus]